MKKILIFLIPLIFLTGCSIERIDKKSEEQLVNIILTNKVKKANTIGMGYKYYLPNDMIRTSSVNGNEILFSNGYKYYLFVDIIAYKNNKPIKYIKQEDNYFNNNEETNEYINITKLSNDLYLIEYILDYAKIEVEVNKKDIKESLIASSYILKTIKFNNVTIIQMGKENILTNPEKPYIISKKAVKENSNFLEYLEKYDKYKGDEIPKENIIINNDEKIDNVKIDDVEKGIFDNLE